VQVLLTILLVILFLSFGLLVWIVVAPIIIKINSTQQVYELHWVSIGHASVLFNTDQIIVAFQIFFFKKRIAIDLFKICTSTKESKPDRKKNKSKSYSFSKTGYKVKKVLQSFQVKKLWLNLDTDDYYYNAFLYPIFFFVKGDHYRLNINYQGKNELILIVKNRFIRILFAIIF
jgi:hypothetical protein